MSNRRSRAAGSTLGAAQGRPTGDIGTTNEWDSAIFGEIAAADAGMQTAYPTNIAEIWPDVAQPRRSVPSQVMDTWTRDPATVADMLVTWWNWASEEAGEELPMVDLLRRNETQRSTTENENTRKPGPMESTLLELIDLASSIFHEGLLQPIMVTPRDGGGYTVVLGERRWLAHQLLVAALGSDGAKFSKIAAVTTPRPDVWKQAQENNARRQLNAIGQARQLALLLMAAYTEKGHTFQPYETFQSDREYYAQVADGNEFPIAYGDGERLVQAMGLKHRSQLNQFRALLRLPDTYWRTGDDNGWTENRLREFAKDLRQSITPVIDLPVSEPTPTSAPPPIVTSVAPHETPAPVLDDVPDLPDGAEDYEPEAPAPLPPPVGPLAGQPAPAPNKASNLSNDEAIIIRLAYARASKTPPGWFSAYMIGSNCGRLNSMVGDGYLDCRREHNTDNQAAVYRINNVGAKAMGFQPLDLARYDAPPPSRSENNDLYAGTQLATGQFEQKGTIPPAAAPRPRKMFGGNVLNAAHALIGYTDRDCREYHDIVLAQIAAVQTVLTEMERIAKEMLE